MMTKTQRRSPMSKASGKTGAAPTNKRRSTAAALYQRINLAASKKLEEACPKADCHVNPETVETDFFCAENDTKTANFNSSPQPAPLQAQQSWPEEESKQTAGVKTARYQVLPGQQQQHPSQQQLNFAQHPVTPFQEKHMLESLDVGACDPAKTVLFYSMLNQGLKRGKETKILALDCERILTKKGDRLARVSIVNFYGNIVFDTLIKPWAKVVDYREWITGIKSQDLKHAPSYPKIAPILKKILNGKVVVGHSLKEDFEHLKLNEDEYACEIRDISEISFFKRRKENSTNHQPSQLAVCHEENCGSPSTCRHVGPYNPFGHVEKRKLKELSSEFLNAKIQQGHHSSIIDARVALALYRTFQLFIEQENNTGFLGQPQAPAVQPSLVQPHPQRQDPLRDLDDFNVSPIPLQDSNMLLAGITNCGNGSPLEFPFHGHGSEMAPLPHQALSYHSGCLVVGNKAARVVNTGQVIDFCQPRPGSFKASVVQSLF